MIYRGGQKIQLNQIAIVLPWSNPLKNHLFKSGFFSNPYFINFPKQISILIKKILKIGKSKFPIQISFFSLYYPSFCFIPVFAATLNPPPTPLQFVWSLLTPLQFVWSPSAPLQFIPSPSACLLFVHPPSSCSITSSDNIGVLLTWHWSLDASNLVLVKLRYWCAFICYIFGILLSQVRPPPTLIWSQCTLILFMCF